MGEQGAVPWHCVEPMDELMLGSSRGIFFVMVYQLMKVVYQYKTSLDLVFALLDASSAGQHESHADKEFDDPHLSAVLPQLALHPRGIFGEIEFGQAAFCCLMPRSWSMQFPLVVCGVF